LAFSFGGGKSYKLIKHGRRRSLPDLLGNLGKIAVGRELDMSPRRLCEFTIAWCLVMVGAPVVQAQAPAAPEEPAATVNSEAITIAEVKAVVEARPSPVPLSAAQQRETRQAALDMLIDDLLMRQFLRKHGGQVQAGEVQKEIDDLRALLKKDNKTVEQVLRDAKQTEEQFRADIAARVQWRNYLRTRFSDQEMKAYYDANKVFFDKIFVRASHILLKVQSNTPPADKQATREKLATLRQEIVAGKISFEEAAKKYSECPSKTKGGDIGPFPYKFVVVEPFARAAFSLKVGDLSDIVMTDFGLHVIKVTERTPGEPSNFDTLKDRVREVYAQEQEWYQRILTEQRKGSKIEVYLQ